jgi:hypothetical protein
VLNAGHGRRPARAGATRGGRRGEREGKGRRNTGEAWIHLASWSPSTYGSVAPASTGGSGGGFLGRRWLGVATLTALLTLFILGSSATGRLSRHRRPLAGRRGWLLAGQHWPQPGRALGCLGSCSRAAARLDGPRAFMVVAAIFFLLPFLFRIYFMLEHQ